MEDDKEQDVIKNKKLSDRCNEMQEKYEQALLCIEKTKGDYQSKPVMCCSFFRIYQEVVDITVNKKRKDRLPFYFTTTCKLDY